MDRGGSYKLLPQFVRYQFSQRKGITFPTWNCRFMGIEALGKEIPRPERSQGNVQKKLENEN